MGDGGRGTSAPDVRLEVDSVTFLLRESHDFGWLTRFGAVFQVFDQQDSGNICFGVERADRRRFIKYAGARTVNYNGEPEAAVRILKEAVGLYEALQYPCLVHLDTTFVTRGGFAAVFDWVGGEGLHPHWRFPPPAKYTDPRSPFYRFRQLPLAKRLAAFEEIVRFHVHVEEKGYVAVDFYDGCILYDFATDTVTLCDIDCYQRKPFRNPMGRLWGSTRFMAPEEFELGAAIDERTNVFGMGATAFCLLGGERDRSAERWEANRESFLVAQKAVTPERDHRFPSVEDFYRAWKESFPRSEGARDVDSR